MHTFIITPFRFLTTQQYSNTKYVTLFFFRHAGLDCSLFSENSFVIAEYKAFCCFSFDIELANGNRLASKDALVCFYSKEEL